MARADTWTAAAEPSRSAGSCLSGTSAIAGSKLRFMRIFVRQLDDRLFTNVTVRAESIPRAEPLRKLAKVGWRAPARHVEAGTRLYGVPASPRLHSAAPWLSDIPRTSRSRTLSVLILHYRAGSLADCSPKVYRDLHTVSIPAHGVVSLRISPASISWPLGIRTANLYYDTDSYAPATACSADKGISSTRAFSITPPWCYLTP